MATKPRLASSVSSLPTRGSRVKTAFRTDKVKLEKLPATVSVTAPEQVINIDCFIIRITADNIVVRQKMKAGSSKQVVKTYPMSKVVSMTMTEGDTGVIQVKGDAGVLVLKDQSVSYEGNWVVSTDNRTGEVTRLNTHNCVVDVVIEEVVATNRPAAAPAGRSSGKTGAKTATRTGGRLRSVKNDSEEEFLD